MAKIKYSYQFDKEIMTFRKARPIKGINKEEIIFIDSLEIENHKTKNLFKNLKNFNFNSALFIYNEEDKSENFKKASSNIPRLAMLSNKGLNVKDLIHFEKIFIDSKSIDQITKRLL